MTTTLRDHLASLPARKQLVREVLTPIQRGKRDRTIHGMLNRLRPGSDGRVHTNLSVATTNMRLASSGGITEEAMCLTGDAEVLTPTGWTRFDHLKGPTTVLQWSPDDTLSWCQDAPLTRAHFTGELLEAKSWFHQLAYTPSHRVPYRNAKDRDWREDRADTVAHFRACLLPVSGRYQGGVAEISVTEARLLAAFQADGSFCKGSLRSLRWQFKKRRKVRRLKRLLNEAGWKWWTTSGGVPKGYTRFYLPDGAQFMLRWLGREKQYGAWLLSWPLPALRAFVEETQFWDATRRSRSWMYFTVLRENAEWIATTAHLTGYSASIRVCANRNRGSYGEHTAQPLYTVAIKPRSALWSEAKHFQRSAHCGLVYCVTTETSYFLVRRHGRICVTGNTNLQNQANKIATMDPLYDTRGVMCADEGFQLASRDYAGAEMFLCWAYAGDTEWIDRMLKGESAHGTHAKEAFHLSCKASEVKTLHPKVYVTSKNLGFLCVPERTEILTSTGWKRHDEIRVGEMVVGYNGANLVWDTVTKVYHYQKAPVVRVANTRFAVECTPNHRWAGTRYHHERRNKFPHVVTAATLNCMRDEIIRTAVFEQEQSLDITPLEAELLGWLWGDGSILRGKYVGATAQAGGKRVKCELRLYQAKPAGLKRLRFLLKRIPHHVHRQRRYGGRERSLTTFILRGAYSQRLWERVRGDYLTKEQIVLAMTRIQRNRLLKGFHGAEGWLSKGKQVCSQNEGETLDAIKLAIFLSGHYPSESAGVVSPYTGVRNRNVRWGKPWVTAQKLKVTARRSQAVWCPRTTTGFWVMRQGRTITLTGNSIYSGSARTAMVTFNKDYAIHGQRTTEKEVQHFQDVLYSLHPLKTWWQEVAQAITDNRGIVQNCFGYCRPLRDPDEHNRLKDALAFFPSSTVAWLMNQAIIMVHDELDRQGEIELFHQNHDELDWQALPQYLPESLRFTKRVMEAPFVVRGRRLHIPTEAKIGTVGGAWGSMSTWKE
jgi:hypothetical protein